MNRRRVRHDLLAPFAQLTVVLVGVALGGAAESGTLAAAAVPSPTGPVMRAACQERSGPFAHCLTRYAPQEAVNRALAVDPRAASEVSPYGWGATDIAAAYRLPAGAGAAPLVAVSIAYDAPNLEQDLNTYRQQYGLPPCTVADGCLRKVNQDGAEYPLPAFDFGWQIESTLDVSMISAACPSCHILVVEADSNSFADLAATEDTAVRLGAQAVSNSYGGRESGLALRYASHYDHPGHAIVVSSGDSGFTAGSFPAVLASVTAVGGTTLSRAANARGWTESAWRYGGSACSAYVSKPAWQHDTRCGMRTVADVAAVAEDLAIYNSPGGGWLTIGGTSASAPIVAGSYALAGNTDTADPGYPYRHPEALFDITTGANDSSGTGSKCGGDYLCTAREGYDAPTGLGTPNGVGAF
jgi:subtilase family serine protease